MQTRCKTRTTNLAELSVCNDCGPTSSLCYMAPRPASVSSSSTPARFPCDCPQCMRGGRTEPRMVARSTYHAHARARVGPIGSYTAFAQEKPNVNKFWNQRTILKIIHSLYPGPPMSHSGSEMHLTTSTSTRRTANNVSVNSRTYGWDT